MVDGFADLQTFEYKKVKSGKLSSSEEISLALT